MPGAPRVPPRQPAPADDATPRYRSGAVARMVRIPVATLRIWESRYRVAAPATTAAGHRLYSADDVRRLALLKQLTEVGHAIGSLAALDMAQLGQVASTHASALAGARATPAPARPWRVVIAGAALARRLERANVLRRLDRPLDATATFASLVEAIATTPAGRVDALLVHAPTLHDDSLAAMLTAAQSWGAKRLGVLHGPATTAACEAFARAGASLLREPQDDRTLAEWLRSLARAPIATRASTMTAPSRRAVEADRAWPLAIAAPRRYDDATLADIAGLSSTIACECPRQVAELLAQLSAFEAYSGECASRSPGDAVLHDYLERVAGAARALFESALERVAEAEGLVLRPGRTAAAPRRRPR